MHIYMSVYYVNAVSAVPVEASRGPRIPWDWHSRWLLFIMGASVMEPSSSGIAASVPHLRHLFNPIPEVVLIVRFTKILFHDRFLVIFRNFIL